MSISPGTRKFLIYSLLMATLSSLVMGGAAIQYANYAIRKGQEQSNKTILETSQKWCEIIITFDNGYRRLTAPLSPTQQVLADEFARLRRDFQCKEG